MNILQLSPQFPFPSDDGGKIGIANITKEFSRQGNNVYFFTFADAGKVSGTALAEGQKITKDIYFCDKSTGNTKSRIALSIIRNKPIFTDKHYNYYIRKCLVEFARDKSIDVIHADHSSMAPLALFLRSKTNKPVGLRLHNIEWQIWKRYADVLPTMHPKRIYIGHQAMLLREHEKHIYSDVDICFAITDKDKASALKLSPKANVVVAGPGVNADEWNPDTGVKRNPEEMILATTYKWVHNVDALKWFLDNVMPLVRVKIPGAYLTLLGKEPPAWLESYRPKGLNLVGYVPEVQPYLNRAGIYIAPLFVGAGIRIKILEAMSMQLPVIATPVSAEGIKAGEMEGLFIAAKPEEFASKIISLMTNETKRETAGKSAREFVLGNFSWERNVGIMLREYGKLL